VLTSTPEIVVAIIAVTQGNSSISIGDILGSNIFNIGAVLGLLGVFWYLKLCCNDLIMELDDTLSIIVLIPLILIVNQYTIYKIPNQLMGVLLLTAFFVNVYLITKKKLPDTKQVCITEDNCELKNDDVSPSTQNDEKKTVPRTKKIIIIGTLVASFALIVVFAQ
jgi:Ca2+/Na+ antiporter